MLWADGLRAAAVAALATLVLAGTLRFWELVALVAFYGAGTAFFTPAFEAKVPELLPPADLPAANSLDQFVRPIALRLAGPFLGGALVAGGAGLAFGVDAASFGASFIAVAAIRPRVPARDATNASALVAVKEGLRFIANDSLILSIVIMVMLTNFLDAIFGGVLQPVYVRQVYGDALNLGLLISANGGGAVIAGLIFAVARDFFVALVANPYDPRIPLVRLFLLLQVLHSFDLPARKDLKYSLASAVGGVVGSRGPGARGQGPVAGEGELRIENSQAPSSASSSDPWPLTPGPWPLAPIKSLWLTGRLQCVPRCASPQTSCELLI